MCGRFAMSLGQAQDITNALNIVASTSDGNGDGEDDGDGSSGGSGGAAWADIAEAESYEPRPEVRPTTHVPVAFAAASAPASLVGTAGGENPVIVRFMRWGLIPSFAGRDFLSGNNPPLINARGESVLEKPAFRAICSKSGSRRCVVVTSGYMEWYTYEEPGPGRSRAASKRKIPYLVHLPYTNEPHVDSNLQSSAEKPNLPLLLAGVYDTWRGGAEPGEGLSFALVTMAANEHLSWLHHRQPVFLTSAEALEAWLNPACSPERACDVAFKAAEGVRNLAWTRLLKDLSAPAPPAEQGKPKPRAKIASIESFFSSPVVSQREEKLNKSRRPSASDGSTVSADQDASPASKTPGQGQGQGPAQGRGRGRGQEQGRGLRPGLRLSPQGAKHLGTPPRGGRIPARASVAGSKRDLDRMRGVSDGKPKQRRIGDFFGKKL